jgi:hypothetical protein
MMVTVSFVIFATDPDSSTGLTNDDYEQVMAALDIIGADSVSFTLEDDDE